MIGNVPPTKLKPVPESVAEVIVIGRVPVADAVTVCVTGVFNVVLPNEIVLELKLRADPLARSWSATEDEEPPADAVRMTDCAELTADIVALNRTAVAFAGTVTLEGKDTALRLLDSFTANPALGAGTLSVIVQASAPDPEIEVKLQERASMPGVPLPLTAIEVFGLPA